MSHILELLAKGLDSDISDMLDRYFWSPQVTGIDEMKACCAEHPDWPDLKFHLGLAYLRGMQLDAAVRELKGACRLKSDYNAARLALACALDESGDPGAALDELKIANQYNPGESAVLFAIGFCNEKLGRTEKAAEYYRDIVADDDGCIPARERLAAIAVVLGNIDEAIVQYEALRDIQPDKTSIRTALAHLYHRAGEFDNAIGEYENAIALEPENWSLMDDEVESLVSAGRIPEAIERLHDLLQQQGEFPDLHVRLGDLYNETGNDEAALKHYHIALDIQPDFLEANVKLGTHHLICGRWDQAADAFHRAAELNDRALLSYVGLGVAQSAAGNTEEAMNSFDLAAAIEPNTSLLMTEMARLQLKAAVADEFLKSFQADELGPQPEVPLDNDDLLHKQIERHADEVRRRPRHADVRYRYGVLLRAEDRTGEAMEQFRISTEINPTYVQALVKLGICRQELGQTDEAIETFKRVLDIKSEYVDMHYRLGLLYTDRRQFDLAVKEMEAASEGSPDNTQVRAALALSLQNMGLMDRAAATWRSLWQIHQAATKA